MACVGDYRMNETKTMGIIAFAGDLDPDPYGAATALRRAGFEVTIMPEKFRSRLAHPNDDFMEASIDGAYDDEVVNAIMQKIDAIVDRYGGLCYECGAMPPDHVPFEELFDGPKYWIH